MNVEEFNWESRNLYIIQATFRPFSDPLHTTEMK